MATNYSTKEIETFLNNHPEINEWRLKHLKQQEDYLKEFNKSWKDIGYCGYGIQYDDIYWFDVLEENFLENLEDFYQGITFEGGPYRISSIDDLEVIFDFGKWGGLTAQYPELWLEFPSEEEILERKMELLKLRS